MARALLSLLAGGLLVGLSACTLLYTKQDHPDHEGPVPAESGDSDGFAWTFWKIVGAAVAGGGAIGTTGWKIGRVTASDATTDSGE